jgi:glycosyltransferase involved in cell wall biosynthesis
MTAVPPVSVVVPTYNSGPFVAATMDSILRQTFVDFELVVTDHASTDDTWDVVSDFTSDPRVRLLRTEAGGGAARNWNRATEEAQGELLKLVCADDLVYPTCLQEQVEALRAHPGATVAACRRDLVDARGDVLLSNRGLPGLEGEVPGPEAIRRTVRAGGNIFGEPACVLLRTSVVRDVGGWSATDPYLIDVDMYVRSLASGSLVALPQTLAAFRVSAEQWSVALVGEQARQTVSFNKRVAALNPGVLTTADVRLGRARAYASALQRRAAYLVWSRRMGMQP